jgi:hypothetical protein
MDILAGFQSSGRSSLEQTAQLLGLPGKLGMSGDKVWEYFRAGRHEEIQNYCETDALNTYLIYLRFQLMRGILDEHGYGEEVTLVRQKLEHSDGAHWRNFIDAWNVPEHGAG